VLPPSFSRSANHILRRFGLAHHPDGDGLLMVMEFCGQGSVDALMQQRVRAKTPFSPLDKLKMIIDAALGVEYLHRQKVQHRDVCAPP
jgi:serine/threonine protein kinase